MYYLNFYIEVMVFLILPLKRQIMMERGITFILFDPLMFLKV